MVDITEKAEFVAADGRKPMRGSRRSHSQPSSNSSRASTSGRVTRSTSRSPARHRRRSRRQSEASSSACSSHYVTADEGESERAVSPDLDQVVNSLGKGLRIALHSQVPKDIRKKKRRQIHSLTSQKAVARALRKQLNQLADSSDEDDEIMYADEVVKLHDLADNKGVTPECFDFIKGNLRKEIGLKLNEADLATGLNLLCEAINNYKLSETQAKQLFNSFLEGNLKTIFIAHKGLKDKVPLADIVAKLWNYKACRVSRAEATEKIKSWTLNFANPKSSIADLESYFLLSRPNSSMSAIRELTKQSVQMQLHSFMHRELLKKEQLYMKKHHGRDMPLGKFIEVVASLVPRPKAGRKEVHRVDMLPYETYAQDCSSDSDSLASEADLDNGDTHNKLDALVGSVQRLVDKMAEQNEILEMDQVQECQINMIERGGQDDEDPGYYAPNSSYFFVHESDPSFYQLMAQLEEPISEGPMTLSHVQGYRWHGEQFYPNVKLEAYPLELDLLIWFNRSYRLTNKFKEFMRAKCISCGFLNNHANSNSMLCPYAGTPDTFHFCQECRSGFHDECLIHPSANPLLQERFASFSH